MQVGDTIYVYEDPVTRLKREGVAEVLRVFRQQERRFFRDGIRMAMHRVKVRFITDDQMCLRWVTEEVLGS